PEAVPEFVVILDNPDSNSLPFHAHLQASFIEIRMRTFVPVPGSLSTWNWPPTDSTRLFLLGNPFPARSFDGSNPRPLSSIESWKIGSNATARIETSDARECRAALFSASFAARRTSRQCSAGKAFRGRASGKSNRQRIPAA